MILRQDDTGTPKVFYVCRGHLGHRLYGNDFLLDSIGTPGVPDPSFREPVRLRYLEALWTGKPTFDRVVGRCTDFWVEYQRLVLPLEKEFIASILHAERIFRVQPPSSE
jgi:hypothetical protein